MKYGKWLNEKPKFDEECVFVTASRYKPDDDWGYNVWQVIKIDGEDENGKEGWYWGLLDDDGDEWGDLADLTAKMYFIVPPINKPLKL